MCEEDPTCFADLTTTDALRKVSPTNDVEVESRSGEIKGRVLPKQTRISPPMRFREIHSSQIDGSVPDDNPREILRRRQMKNMTPDRVLLVDSSNSSFEQGFLQRANYDTLTAQSGESAIAEYKRAVAQSAHFTIVLTHVKLPDMSGMELAKTLRAFEQSSAQRGMRGAVIVGYMSSPSPQRVEACRLAGMDGAMTKGRHLVSRLKKILAAHSNDDQPFTDITESKERELPSPSESFDTLPSHHDPDRHDQRVGKVFRRRPPFSLNDCKQFGSEPPTQVREFPFPGSTSPLLTVRALKAEMVVQDLRKVILKEAQEKTKRARRTM
jgi:CheY-like chemotaxis protein